jgi:hypothetical protein
LLKPKKDAKNVERLFRLNSNALRRFRSSSSKKAGVPETHAVINHQPM